MSNPDVTIHDRENCQCCGDSDYEFGDDSPPPPRMKPDAVTKSVTTLIATVTTLIRALGAEHSKVNSSPRVLHYSFECDVCALLAALKGEK